jgi:hypothetical protein
LPPAGAECSFSAASSWEIRRGFDDLAQRPVSDSTLLVVLIALDVGRIIEKGRDARPVQRQIWLTLG